MRNWRWQCIAMENASWLVVYRGDCVGWIEHRHTGRFPFEVFQTVSGKPSEKSFLGSVATVLDGFRLIQQMENVR